MISSSKGCNQVFSLVWILSKKKFVCSSSGQSKALFTLLNHGAWVYCNCSSLPYFLYFFLCFLNPSCNLQTCIPVNLFFPRSDLFHWRQDHTISVCSASIEWDGKLCLLSAFTWIPFKAKFTQFRKKHKNLSEIHTSKILLLMKHMRTNSLRIKEEEISLLTISTLYYNPIVSADATNWCVQR